MLTGLVTALGAGARFTNRSSKLGGLVKNGCNKATISITLYNEGEDAYKPEIYGPLIIIERTIMKDGGGSYVMKDHKGRKVSGSRQELEMITDQFNIQVDNPCTVLMQDASKMFLNSNKPEKKYELFLKATQLEQMKVDLEEIGENLKISEGVLTAKQESLKTMEERIKSLEAKVQALNALQEYRTKLKDLRAKLAWSHVQQQEADLMAIEEEMASNDEKIAKLTEARLAKQSSLSKMQGDQQEKAAALDMLRGDAEEISRTGRQLADEERAIKNEATQFDAEIEARKQEQVRLQNRREVIRNQIRKLQTAGQGDKKEAEYRKRLEKAEQHRARVVKLMEDMKKAEETEPSIVREIEADEDAANNIQMQLDALNKEIQKYQAEHNRLKSTMKDRNAAFGVTAPAVVQLIQRHQKEFERPPVGPIGMFVSLLEEEWSVPVEGLLGKTMEKFVVHSVRDMKKLQTLIRGAKISPEPQLVVLPLDAPRYNLQPKDLPDARFKTLLSTIRVDNDACFNALIDEASPEGTILFHEKAPAKAAMFPPGANHGPKNVKDAFSLEQNLKMSNVFGTQVISSIKVVQPRLQADVSEALRAVAARLGERQQTLPPIQKEFQSINQRLNRARAQLKEAREVLRKGPADIDRLNAECEELEKPPEVEPSRASEINAIQATLPDIEAKIDAESEQINLKLEEKRVFLRKLDPIIERQKQNKKRKEDLEALLTEAAKELDTLGTGIAAINARLPQYGLAIEKLTQTGADLLKRHETQSHLVEEVVVKARLLQPRPKDPITDSSEKLQKLIEKLEATITQQEEKEELSASVLEDYENSKQTLLSLQSAITETQETIDLAAQMLTARAHKWVQFRRFIAQRANALFISYLSYRNYQGELQFDHKERTLNIIINPNRADVGGSRDTTTLSGGERSYATVSLLLALWDTMESPFRAMDEFDVFMDTANRKISMELLIEAATEKASRQHIFLTPQQLQSVHTSDKIKVFRMIPPVRNNRTITEMIGGDGE